MKKLIVLVLGTILVSLSGTAVANSAPDAAAQTNTATTGSLAAETINDISIPTEVLLYVQTNYQGYAVTQASKAARDGKPVYSLRVDPNDITTDYDGFYLLYDMNWKLLGEEKMTPPAPKPEPKPQITDEKKPASDKPHTEQRNTKPKKPRHGN